MEKRKATSNYALPACLLRGQLDQLRHDLCELIEAAGSVEIDAGNVLEIDAAGLQLLLSAAMQAAANSKPFSLTVVSDPTRKAASANRLGEAMGL